MCIKNFSGQILLWADMEVVNGFTCALSQWRREAWVGRRSFFESLGITSFGKPVNSKGETAECNDVAVLLGGIVVVAHPSTFDDPEESK